MTDCVGMMRTMRHLLFVRWLPSDVCLIKLGDELYRQVSGARQSSIVKMGFLQALSVASVALASSVQAAVSPKGLTLSLNDVDYFLPGKPTASISGCEELQASFKDGPFVPITVVKSGSVDVASYSEDDVWQPAFLEGMFPKGPTKTAF